MKYLNGETYNLKETLKSLYGAKWDKDRKQWGVNENVYEEAQALVNEHTEKMRKEREEFNEKHVLVFSDHNRAYADKYGIDAAYIEANLYYFFNFKYKTNDVSMKNPYVKRDEAEKLANLFKKIVDEKFSKEEKVRREQRQKLIMIKAAMVEKLDAIKERPLPDEKNFINKSLQDVKSGNLLRAEQVHRYRSIWSKYSEYFSALGIPDDIRNANCQRQIIRMLEEQEAISKAEIEEEKRARWKEK